MLLVKTTYLPATNFRGSRIKAEWMVEKMGRQSLTIPYPHELDSYEGHKSAVILLVAGCLPEKPVEIVEIQANKYKKGFYFGIN